MTYVSHSCLGAVYAIPSAGYAYQKYSYSDDQFNAFALESDEESALPADPRGHALRVLCSDYLRRRKDEVDRHGGIRIDRTGHRNGGARAGSAREDPRVPDLSRRRQESRWTGFKEIAAKHKSKPEAEAAIVAKLSAGKDHPATKAGADDVKSLVKWILSQ